MRYDFSNLTSCPSSMTKHTTKFSCKVDARWLFKSHLTSTWDDIWKVYKGKILQIFIIWPWDIEEVTSNSKVLTWGALKMTFQILPHIHLVWPSVPFTTPKFSCEVHMRWLSILTLHPSCVPPTKMSPPNTKVTSHKHFSPCITILILCPPHVPPPRENNIFHLAWKNSEKSQAATPIPSIRYLLRATKYVNQKIRHA